MQTPSETGSMEGQPVISREAWKIRGAAQEEQLTEMAVYLLASAGDATCTLAFAPAGLL